MTEQELAQQIQALSLRLADLKTHTAESESRPALLADALKELTSNLEILVAAREQIRAQDFELLYERETLKAESEGHAALHDLAELNRPEENLKRALAWQGAIFDGSRDAIIVTDADSRITSVNAAACRLTGYSKEELLTMRILELHEDIDLHAYRHYHDRIMAGEESLSEAMILRKDGSKVDTEFNNRRIVIDGVPYMHTTARDVSERKQAEVAIRASEMRYRSLFENMMEGYAYCRMFFEENRPEDFVYLAVNHAFEVLTGLKNVVGRKVTGVMPGIKESNPELFEIYGRVALTGRPERFETFLESLGIWLSIAVQSPGKEYFIAIFDNITERKQIEGALRRSEERFRGEFDNMMEGCQIIGFDWRYLYVNDAAAKHDRLGKDQLLGRTMVEVYPGIEETDMFSTLRRCMEERTPCQLENKFYCPTAHPPGSISASSRCRKGCSFFPMTSPSGGGLKRRWS